MKHSIRLLILATCASLAACGRGETESRTAAGQARQASQSENHRYADGDRDGRVTREEALADPMLSASFDRYDMDDNDELDRGEFARLEARALDRREEQAAKDAEAERHRLRPRREFPRPYD